VTPGQSALVFRGNEAPRLLLGEEALLLQGFPVAAVAAMVENTPNHVMADLAGNMVAVPVLLALLMAAVACVDWRGVGDTVGDTDDESDIEAATLAFKFAGRR